MDKEVLNTWTRDELMTEVLASQTLKEKNTELRNALLIYEDKCKALQKQLDVCRASVYVMQRTLE